jgi:hypothetical protein
LEDAEQLELVVHIFLLLLQVNRTCAASVWDLGAKSAIDLRLTAFEPAIL